MVEQQNKKREKEKDLMAYEMAKQIAEFSSSYGEAMSIINRIKGNFEWARERRKPEVPPYPVDNWGIKIEMSGTEAPDTKK